MKLSRIMKITVITALSAVALSGCAGGSSSGAEKDVTIGFSTYTLANPYFAGLVKGLQQGADKHGYELITTNSNSGVDGQVTDIENLISRGIDYLVLTPADAKAIEPAIRAAQDAGIPVIVSSDPVEADVTATIAIDSIDASGKAAVAMAEWLEKTTGEAAGDIFLVNGEPGSTEAIKREEGFRKKIAEYPDINIVAAQPAGWDTEQASRVTTDLLQAHPSVKAIFAANDSTAIGVLAALRGQGKLFPVDDPRHVFVSGVDGAKPAIEDIRNGFLDGTISGNPIKMSEETVDIIADLVDGKEPPSKLITWPSQLITTSNIDSQEVLNYGIWADEVE